MTGLHMPSGWGASGFLIAIPALDEARRLPGAFVALAGDGVVRDIIVIANGCTDATAAIARAGHPDLRVAVLETGRLQGGVGAARRLGIEAAMTAAPRAAILATSDADCQIGPGWGALTLDALARADVVCGRVVPAAAEFARLPALVRRHGRLEDLASDLRAERDGLTDPKPHDPLPRHEQTPGASLAFRTEVYRAVGGFEPIPCNEDRRIVARIAAAGGRIARPHALTVAASCRLTGRAAGGMADTIAARAADRPLLRREIAALTDEIAQLRREIASLRFAPAPAVIARRSDDALRAPALP